MQRGNGSLMWFASTFFAALVIPAGASSQALDPNIIIGLKNGHMKTCPGTVAAQIKSIGASLSQEKVLLYCECLGTLYFNDMTKSEYSEMLKNGGSLPNRIASMRRRIQEHCASVHL